MLPLMSTSRTRPLVPALLHLGVAIAVAAPAQAGPPEVDAAFWETCEAERDHGLVFVACGDVVLNHLTGQSAGVDAPGFLDAANRLGLEQLRGEGFTPSGEGTRDLGRPDMPALGFAVTLADPEGPLTGRGLVASAAAGPTTFRQFHCLDLRAEPVPPSCASLAAHVLSAGFPDGLVPPAGPGDLRLAGRALALPEGCATNTGEDINCVESHLAWETVADGTDPEGSSLVGGTLAAMREVVPLEPAVDAVACRFEGVEASCRRRTWAQDGRTLMVFISGAVRVRGERTAFACSWKVGELAADAVPPACAGVLALPR